MLLGFLAGTAFVPACGGQKPAPKPADAADAAATGGASGSGAGGVGGATAGSGGASSATGGSGGTPSATGGAIGSAGIDAGVGAGGSGAGGRDAGAAGGAGGNDGAAPGGVCSACTSWGQPELLGKVTAPGLDALSGMAASWHNPGVVYAHNDHDRPVIFALDQKAGLLARVTLTGVVAHDIEDMGVSRCPAGTCLYAADIGNNTSPRSEFAIFRAAEPEIPAGAPSADRSVPAETFAFRYADEPHNAESLVIDPGTGDVFIITKLAAGQPSAAYKLDGFVLGKVNVANKIADLPVPAAGDQPATSANAQPCGGGFLLRTGSKLFEFRIPVGAAFASAFHVAPVVVPAGSEPQSEAVSYAPDGRAYYTTGETAGAPVYRVRCQ
jgi:hypothetical protein